MARVKTKGSPNQQRDLKKQRYEQTVQIWTERNGDITARELGKILGISDTSAGSYISEWFKERAEKKRKDQEEAQ